MKITKEAEVELSASALNMYRLLNSLRSTNTYINGFLVELEARMQKTK